MMNPDSNNQNIPKGLDDLLGSIRSDSEILGEDYDQNIPKGLDDLLSSIRGKSEPDNSSALAVYVPDQREEDLVSEQIDERILTLLGLEDAIDIDYATYKTLLREKMMEGRMADSKMPTEETEILTEEFRRVKGNTGRFKVKREKINFESFVADVKPQEQSRPQSSLLSLPGTAEPDVEVGQDPETGGIQKFLGGISDRLAEIEKNLSDMLDMDAKELADEKKDADKERVVGEKQKKRKKESKLESSIKGIGSKITEKVTKPAKNLLMEIIKFFTMIFLGNMVKKLIEFLQNPMTIFNPFINFINGFIELVNKVLNFMFGGIIDPLNNMVGFLNGGIENLENTVNGIFGLFGEQEEEDKIKLPKIPEAKTPQIPTIPLFEAKSEESSSEEKGPSVKGMKGGGLVVNEGPTYNVKQNVGGYSEGGQVTNLNFGNIGGYKGGDMTISPKVSGFKGGGKVNPTYNFLSPITNFGYSGGGSVINTSTTSSSSSPINVSNFGYTGGGSITGSSGQTITGMGPDTQLIAAQPGEIMMSKKAVQAYGANNLLAMNKSAGGTNVPTMGTIQGFSGGGSVSPFPEGSYKGESGQVFGDSRDYGGHVGIDVTENSPFKSDPKRPIYAPVHSKVLSEKYQSSGYTSGLMLDHGDGLQSRYVHMIPMKRPGDEVKAGEQIGKLLPLGKSPSYLSTHLHFELYKGPNLLNPTSFYKGLVKGQYKPSSSRGTGDLNKFNAGEGAKISAQVSSTSPGPGSSSSIPGPPPSKGTGGMSAIPIPGSNQQQPPTSSVSAGQKDVPSFSSRDMGNTEFIVIKSIYNIAG